jgi:hypothetical protein
MDQFDNDFEKYIKQLERRMWRALGIVGIIAMVVILLIGICYS